MGFVAKGFEPDVNKLKRRLGYWFKYDHLRPEQGIALLIGMEPNSIYIEAVANWGKNRSNDNEILDEGIMLLNGEIICSYPKSDDPEISDREYCGLGMR